LSAGRALEPIAGSTGKVFSESQFLTLRAAGVRGLVTATDGKGIFTEAGCATCHTLATARASGTVGPNLGAAKRLKPDVVFAVTDGSGVMLSFKGTLSATQIQAVADFVSQNTGK